jgi:E3 ubiquitin-protein ligase RNF146
MVVNNNQWFYEGHNGWWKFEARNNEELENAFQRDGTTNIVEILICGRIYIMNLTNMEQYRKDGSGKKRRLKRDAVFAQCKGVAGLVLKKE